MLSQNPILASHFPIFSQLDSSLYRERLIKFPRLPTSRSELILPDHLMKTIAGSDFFLYSSDNNDLLIFGTQNNINKLSMKSHWCVEGTFKSVPSLYLQLCTIHVLEGDKLNPLIYCLLSAKTRVMYSEVFRRVNDRASNMNFILSPDILTCDFESGLIASIRLKFPTVVIRGCYSHFCQSVYRNVQPQGLSPLYVNELNCGLYIRKLLALAFIPIDQILESFARLKNHCSNELIPLFQYFESHWINTIDRTLWKMHCVQRRTNNNLEEWHLRLNRAVGRAHANIYEFISKLINEQGATETLLAQIESGNTQFLSRNNIYTQIIEQINVLTTDYISGEKDMDEFLDGIAHNISQHINISL